MLMTLKKNALLLMIITALCGLGCFNIGNTASAIQAAAVVNTKIVRIYTEQGRSETTYTWRQLTYRRGFTYRITSEYKAFGLFVVEDIYTYHYTTY